MPGHLSGTHVILQGIETSLGCYVRLISHNALQSFRDPVCRDQFHASTSDLD